MPHTFTTNENGTIAIVGAVAATTTPFSVDTDIVHTSGTLLDIKSAGTVKQAFMYDGAIKTTAPTSGTEAAFKLGDVVNSGSQILNTGRYIIAEIGGVNYKLATFLG